MRFFEFLTPFLGWRIKYQGVELDTAEPSLLNAMLIP
jgi:hypothetical protein